jgi:hypothetical protein
VAAREAIGYSNSFSFDEAFRDAMQNLKPRPPSHPDEMTGFTVTGIGAQFGGIAGLRRMFVRIQE